MDYEAVIGLEVHAELLTNTKIFCSCPAKFGAEPNTHVCPVCLGMPGVLPVLNKNVLEFAIKAALAINCEVPNECKFDRKNYFYPDLPKAYQISQYDQPIGQKGFLEIEVNGTKKIVNITRIHMEEDAGKLVHSGADRLAGSTYSLADYNRAGVPLVEIVSEPEIRSSEEAKAYVEELRSILVCANVCDGKMEEGSLRCDANVSIRPRGTEKFGTRVEIKNLNSFRSLQRAIDYEIGRQKEALEYGERIVQETRLWDENKGVTNTMRTKEEAEDYRYFPDPDLVSMIIDAEWLKRVSDSLPELPAKKRERYITQFGLSEYDARVLVNSTDLIDFFEEAVKSGVNAKTATNWLTVDITSYLNDKKLELKDTKLTPPLLSELLSLIEKGTISGKIAKEILPELMESGESPTSLVEKKGATQINDEGKLADIVKTIVESNPKQVQEYLSGKDKILGFFVGQAMKQTQGRANPEVLNKLVKEELNKLK